MTRIDELIEQIQDTNAALHRMERAAINNPNRPSVHQSIQSLRKRQQVLEVSFAKLATEQSLDICDYRTFKPSQEEKITIHGLTSALGDWQSLFTIVYDARKNGPKRTNKVSASMIAATSFGFGYSYPGSIGVVLTLPKNLILFGPTEYENTVDTIFKMVLAETPDEISEWARLLGAAPVKLLYKWAADQVIAGIGADISWTHEEKAPRHLLVQPSQLRRLQQLIEQTGDEEEDTLPYTGNLVAADTVRHTFRMELEGGGEVHGKMSPLIGKEFSVELPKRYTAEIRRTTRINYSRAEDEIKYYMLSIQ